jgi:hypothetical protein
MYHIKASLCKSSQNYKGLLADKNSSAFFLFGILMTICFLQKDFSLFLYDYGKDFHKIRDVYS